MTDRIRRRAARTCCSGSGEDEGEAESGGVGRSWYIDILLCLGPSSWLEVVGYITLALQTHVDEDNNAKAEYDPPSRSPKS